MRRHAETLLSAIGVSRIVVVDDEYFTGQIEVEELLGICTLLTADRASALPHLHGIDFEADREIWADRVRETWEALDEPGRREVLERARVVEERTAPEGGTADADRAEGWPSVARGVDGAGKAAVLRPGYISETHDPADPGLPVDTRAARSLEGLLGGLERCAFVTLSLQEWKERACELLTDEMASTTVYLFDRDFGREKAGTRNEGFNLLREVQRTDVGFCGLISHTIQIGSEYEAWRQLAEEHSLERDRFVVIAKERVTGESPDHYSFLRMLRLVALSRRCAAVKTSAWTVFEASVEEAKGAVERLSVLDFDQIVLASSRREGVWEPDTLFRAFGILMRREARRRLHQDVDIQASVSEARRISAIPEDVEAALGQEQPSREALRIQRFETYEAEETLGRFCLPLELGDIFEMPTTGRRFILLTQPCDLMVRKNGKRNYDDKNGRTGSLVELVVGRASDQAKESWKEVPFYDQDTGAPAYADFAKVHQVQLAVLDLCALRKEGIAKIEIGASCPEVVIEPWRKRYQRLQRLFEAALGRYEVFKGRQVNSELRRLALPPPSTTARFDVVVNGKTVWYDLKRVMRLNQPWSGALLTRFAQYQARAAFEHPFDHRVPMPADSTNGVDPDEVGKEDAPE